MPINLKTHIQMQSKIMKKRQRKKNNKNVFIPLIPVEMTEEEVKQILKTRMNQMIGVICIIVLVMEFVFQMSFPKWGLISTVVLLAGGAIYGFYIHDYFQAMMCVADIGFFVYAYEHFNK